MIEVRNLVVRYGNRRAINDLTFSISAGECLAVLGGNGAGKSTLLKALSSELPVAGGTIQLEGEELRSWSAASLACRRAVLPQESALSFPFTVGQVIEMGCAPFPRRRHSQALSRATELADIGQFLERKYNTLSGGERQRVQWARVLAQILCGQDKRLLILDEPTSALDPPQASRLMQVVRDLRNDGVAAIVVAHDINLAAQFADRILLLNTGRKVGIGTPREVLTTKNLATTYGMEVNVIDHPEYRSPLVVPAYK